MNKVEGSGAGPIVYGTSTTYREPSLEDGKVVWSLVLQSGVLDPNSPYCYLTLFRDFSDTCVVAERDHEVVGFVTAYRPPANPGVIFVWQIGVAEAARRGGLGAAMLLSLLERDSCRGVTHLEATVTPTNQPSLRLFRSLARRLNAQFAVEPCFGEDLFPDGGHEEEQRIRVGPIENFRHRNGEYLGNH